ncbi:MAG: lipoate--protein ligase [Prevotella sp.]|nr:lipoate--protein ligase [Prevotella sp.]MBQ2168968.1 lipoate--protein ligase [Prevotella sp.]
MIHTTLPFNQTRRLSFYLAMEEYVARHLNHDDDCFFMWQVNPSVIFGRNQLIDKEVNIDYCKKHHIEMYRRKSGGGCVYADMSNVMFSYITRDENVNFTFNRYINLLVLVLFKMGIDAKANGRNDILIDGKKVSGNAFYHIPGHSIVHGTMLYDTNMENMVGSISPNNEKLISKGVESVRQRVALLKDYTNLSLDEFKAFAVQQLCNETQALTEQDIMEIEDLEKEYLTHEFIYGHNPRYSIIRKHRLEGVGEFEIRIELKNEIIKQINMMGDYFLVGDIDNRLLLPLRNVPYTKESVEKALPNRVDDIILNLDKKDLIEMIFND